MKKFIILLIILTSLITTSAVISSPTIEGETDVIHDRGYLILNWTIIDDNPKSYEVLLNDTDIVGFGTWDETQIVSKYLIQISMDVDPGTYIFMLKVTDYDNNEADFITTVIIESNVIINPVAFVPFNNHFMIIGFATLIICKKKILK